MFDLYAFTVLPPPVYVKELLISVKVLNVAGFYQDLRLLPARSRS